MKQKFLVMLAILAIMCWSVVAFPPGAQATLTLLLDDNAGNSVTIADGSGSDANGAAGSGYFHRGNRRLEYQCLHRVFEFTQSGSGPQLY